MADYCQKQFGVSLSSIGLIERKASKLAGNYKHPDTGALYYYGGFGKVPAWLKGADDKPRQDLLHKSN